MAPIVTSSPLAVVVLLPEALPSALAAQGSPSSPPQLTSRRSTHGFSPGGISPLLSATVDSDGPAAGSRRLSLAPGLGAGIKMSSSRPPGGSASPVRSPSATRSPSSLSPLTKPSADDSGDFASSLGRTGSGSRTNRRSSNPHAVPAGVSAALKQPRGSVAAPSGMGLTAVLASGRRPGAEGDELVNVLRNGGLEGEWIDRVTLLAPPRVIRAPCSPCSLKINRTSSASGRCRLAVALRGRYGAAPWRISDGAGAACAHAQRRELQGQEQCASTSTQRPSASLVSRPTQPLLCACACACTSLLTISPLLCTQRDLCARRALGRSSFLSLARDRREAPKPMARPPASWVMALSSIPDHAP